MTWSGERRPWAVEVLAETISENNTAPPRYQVGLGDDIRNDGRSTAVTEFTSSPFTHLPTARGVGLARISGEVESIFKELVVA
jgi:hypothetical protein